LFSSFTAVLQLFSEEIQKGTAIKLENNSKAGEQQ
jgi:hypothetical protein